MDLNRKHVAAAARFVASALLIALLIRLALREDFRGVLSRITLVQGCLLLLGYMAVHFAGVCKWTMLVRAAGARLPFVYAIRCYATGLFGNIFLPSNIGGDVISMGMAMRHAGNKTFVVAGTLASRGLDFAALLTLAIAGLAFLPSSLPVPVHDLFRWGSVAGGGCVLAFAIGIPYRFRRTLVQARRAVRSMIAHPYAVVLGLTTSMVLQTALLLLNYWVAGICGVAVPARAWLFAWPLAKFIAFIPVSQGGFGTREFALAGLLAPFAIKPELVVAVGLVWDVILVIGGLIGGGVSLLLGRLGSHGRD